MKLNILKPFMFTLFAMQYQLSIAQQTETVQKTIPDSWCSWNYHDVINTQSENNIYGNTNNDIIYRFHIMRPAILVVNHAGSELTNTSISMAALIMYFRPFYRKDYSDDSSAITTTKSLWSSLPADLRDAISADEKSIMPKQAFLCWETSCGNHTLFCEGSELSNGSANNGNIKTNIYVHYLGGNMAEAIDIGTYGADFSVLEWAETQLTPQQSDSVSIYYKFKLIRPLEVTICENHGPTTKILLLDSSGHALDFSDNYPFLKDSLPQIGDRLLSEGTYYLVSSRYEGGGLSLMNIKGELPPVKEGDNAENPVDFGAITKSFHESRRYDTSEYNDCYSGYYSSGKKDVYLKFSFPCDVEFSLSPDDGKVGGAYVTLLDCNQKQLQFVTTNVYPNTSLYKPRLAAGTYYVVLEGAGKDGELGAEIRILPLNNLADSQWAPSVDMNYVVTMMPTYETSNPGYVSPKQSNTSIEYYDQLGRPVQAKQYAASPNGNDVTVQQEYNVFGLQSKSYLPVDEGNTGAYSSVDNVLSRAGVIYNDANPYQLTTYDGTPLMRVVEQYGPGQIWQGAGKSIKSHSDLNMDSIIRFSVQGLRSNPNLIRINGYASKSLSVASLTDEDGHSVYKFTDINGRNILTRVENGSEMLDTYSVYDDYGNLCFVLPPMVDAANVSAAELDKYAYKYRYDYRNRCVGKKLPGAEWVYSVYDYADNLLLTQDGESRSRGEWNCILYDKLSRPVISGVYRGTVDRKSISAQVISAMYDNTGSYGYSFNALKSDSLNVLTATYYDNYDFKNIVSEYNANLDYVGDDEYGTWHNNYIYNAKGLATGSVTAVLDDNKRICTATYYDVNKRPVQVRATTLEGGFSINKFRYDFVGNVVKEAEIQRPTTDASSDTVIRDNEYDKTGRKLSVRTSLNGGTSAVIRYEYDNIGRLVAMTQGEGTDTIRTERKYNVRGWLTEQNSNLFSMTLKYTNPEFVTPSYTGNIMEWSWQHGADTDENIYAFTYDALFRLTNTYQYENGIRTDHNVEQGMSYDRNGNICSMSRYADGQVSSAYSYRYNGNQLASQGTPSVSPVTLAMATANTDDLMGASQFGPINPGHSLRPVEPGPIIPVDPIDPDIPSISIDTDHPIKKPIDPDSIYRPILPPHERPHFPIYTEPDDAFLPFISPDTVYSGNTFRYDYNGNMVYDAFRDRNMRYNRLNLIKKIFDGEATLADYRYLADGTKLGVVDRDGNGLEYHGSLVYRRQNNVLTLESGGVDGGRILANQTSSGVNYTPQYYLTDHLGSTRAVTDGTVANTVSYDYYPFGKQWSNPDSQLSDNRYLFNGKEWQPTGNVNLLDYGARMYDQELSRWLNPDVLQEKYYMISPYNFCAGNPIVYVDIYGMDLIQVAVPANVGGSKTKMIIVDSKAATQFYKFAWEMNAKFGLVVNSDFRSKSKQAEMRANWDMGKRTGLVVRPAKTSAHSGGFAVDMNVAILGLTKSSYNTKKGQEIMSKLSEMAAAYGFYYGGDFNVPDVPHFYLNETDFGYSSREDAMDVNDKYMQDNGSNIPVFNPKSDEQETERDSYHTFIQNNINNPFVIMSYWLSVNPNIVIK